METRKTISGLDDQTIDLAINPDVNNPLELCRGIDNMAHTSKGIIAIRLDDCVHASVVNVNISTAKEKEVFETPKRLNTYGMPGTIDNPSAEAFPEASAIKCLNDSIEHSSHIN